MERIIALYGEGQTINESTMPKHNAIILIPDLAEAIYVTCKLKGATGLESENIVLQAAGGSHSRIYPLELSSISDIAGINTYIGLIY